MTDSQQANEIKAGNTFLGTRKSPSSDVAALAQTVRDALDALQEAQEGWPMPNRYSACHDAARPALAALEERAAQAEAAFAIGHETLLKMQDRAEAAEARADRLETALRSIERIANEAFEDGHGTYQFVLIADGARAALAGSGDPA